MSLCSNSPLQTEDLLTHQFSMVIPNVSADLSQPAQGGVLSATLHLVPKYLTDKWRFRTVTVKFKTIFTPHK